MDFSSAYNSNEYGSETEEDDENDNTEIDRGPLNSQSNDEIIYDENTEMISSLPVNLDQKKTKLFGVG